MKVRKIFIASDHAGFRLKEFLISSFKQQRGKDLEVVDLGPSDESRVDYPDYAKAVCSKVQADWNAGTISSMGILICGSGQGVAMSANRHKGIRGALCWDIPSAKLSREHNNANVLCLGARLIPFESAFEITKTWLNTEFAGGRHANRVDKIEC